MKDLIKKVIKAPMFLVFSIMVILSTMSACILSINAAKPNSETNQYTVTFPTYTDAIEELEYSIGTLGTTSSSKKPEWRWDDWKSVDGELSAKVTNQNKIKFLVKFKEGYSDFLVNNVKINSDAQGENNTSSLVICEKNEDGEIITRDPYDDEKINEKTFYSSKEITINQDQTLSFEDIILNNYSLTLNVPVSEEVFDVYCDMDNDKTSQGKSTKITPQHKEGNYVYTLNNVPYGTVANFEMRLKDKYSKLADKNFDIFPKESNTHFLKVDNSSRRFAWEAKENAEIDFDIADEVEVTSNKYDIKNTTGKTLYYKDSNSGEDKSLQQGESVNIDHGTTCSFYTQDGDTLVYDGNKGMNKKEKDEKVEYYVPNITSNHNINIKREAANSTYRITFKENEGINFINNSNNKKITEGEGEGDNIGATVNSGEQFQFKLGKIDGYSKYFEKVKLSYKKAGSTDESGTPLEKDENGVYTLTDVKENITVFATTAPEKDQFTVKIAKTALELVDMQIKIGENNIERDEKNELYYVYYVDYNSNFNIIFTTIGGGEYTLEKMALYNKGREIYKGSTTPNGKEKTWTISNQKDNMVLTIGGISRRPVNFTFNNNYGDAQIVYAPSAQQNTQVDLTDPAGSYYIKDGAANYIQKGTTSKFSVPYGSDVFLKFKSSLIDKFEIHRTNVGSSTEDILENDSNGFCIINNVKIDGNLTENAIFNKEYTITVRTACNNISVSANGKDYYKMSTNRDSTFKAKHGTPFRFYYGVTEPIEDEYESWDIVADETLYEKSLNKSSYKYNGKDFCYVELYDNPEYNPCGNIVTSDMFLWLHNRRLENAEEDKLGDEEFNGKDDKRQLVSARNITSYYELIQGDDEDEDYEVNFDEYATDMDKRIGIKTKVGKEYSMRYHVVDNDGLWSNKWKNNKDTYINCDNDKNISGCDYLNRYEAPSQLNIKLKYGKKCTADNFLGYQFNVVPRRKIKQEDIFGLRKQFFPNSKTKYNDPYINTKANKGTLPTDSLRGMIQVHYVMKTLSIGKALNWGSNWSIFNSRKREYDDGKNVAFYSMLLRADNLNYVAKNRDVTSETAQFACYSERNTPTGYPYKFLNVLSQNDIKSSNETYNPPYRWKDDKLWLLGKNETAKDEISSGNTKVNIRTNTLLVYDSNHEDRYEDDVIPEPNYDDGLSRDVRKFVKNFNYDGFSLGSGDWVDYNNTCPAYSKNYDYEFDLRCINAFDKIEIKPIFDVDNITSVDNLSVTFPIESTGIKFYECESDYTQGKRISERISEAPETKDPQGIWYHEKNKEAWSCRFIVRPDEGYNFIPGSLKVTPEGYSILSYQERSDSNGKYYIYTIKNFQKEQNVVTVPQIEKYRFTVRFNDGYTDFYDSQTGDQFLKKELDMNSNFTFKTRPQVGYQSDEDLIINTGNDTFRLIAGSSSNSVTLPGGTKITRKTDISSTNENLYEIESIKENFSIFSTRNRSYIPVTLTYDSSVYYKDTGGKYMKMISENGEKKVSYVDTPEGISNENIELTVDYGSNFYFTIEEREGFDPLSTIVTANNIKLDYENGKYAVKNITSETTIKIDNASKITYKAYFTDHEGLTFKSVDGKDLIGENIVSYGSNLIFKVNISEAYSNSENYKIMVEYSTEGEPAKEIPKEKNAEGNDTDRYILENIQENVRIYVEGLEHNTYKMKLYNSEGILYYDKYGQEKYVSNGEFIERTVYHGEDFSFKIFAEEGYDISEIKVYSKQEKSGLRKQLLPSNGVYTIEKASDNCTITVENTKKSVYNIEIRTTSGARCLDGNGNVLDSNLTVNHGDSFEFTIALDKAYDHSTPIVTLKGSINTISPVDGKYVISNITENKIIEITGVKKNTYKATFKEAEGVIYKNGKNKPFTGSLDAEDGETLNFKITLMDAYDKSSPIVLLNNSKPIAESAGVYSVNDVDSDLEISVENVYKNPEEVTMEDVNNVPDKVSTELDISRVVTATRTYMNLSDEEKAEVTNLADLKRAQQEAGVINHKSGDISVTGLDWNIKVIVDKLTGDQEKVNYMNGKVDRREVLYLYDIYLIDLLTDEVYEIPYGNKVTVTMPAPDLSGYKNEVVVHEKSNGNIEYIDMNITDGTARFDATSFSLFGIAAKKIPNYSDPSGTKIHVSDLVDNEEELQALLGEGVSSQLGDLTENKNDIDVLGGEDGILSKGKSGLAALYEWILNHELLSVIIILIIGSLLIVFILLRAQKENSNKN